MGLYLIPCSICNKDFQWFSGNRLQLCPECLKTAVVKGQQEESPKAEPVAFKMNSSKDGKIVTSIEFRLKK